MKNPNIIDHLMAKYGLKLSYWCHIFKQEKSITFCVSFDEGVIVKADGTHMPIAAFGDSYDEALKKLTDLIDGKVLFFNAIESKGRHLFMDYEQRELNQHLSKNAGRLPSVEYMKALYAR